MPVVQAVGEGEAMCAALAEAGLVDACHTRDVDALLFGAPCVYKSLHLQVGLLKKGRKKDHFFGVLVGRCIKERGWPPAPLCFTSEAAQEPAPAGGGLACIAGGCICW